MVSMMNDPYPRRGRRGRPDEIDAETVLAVHDLSRTAPPTAVEVAMRLGVQTNTARARLLRARMHGWLWLENPQSRGLQRWTTPWYRTP